MKIVAIGVRALINRPLLNGPLNFRMVAHGGGLLGLVAAGMVLAGCQGGAHTQDRQFWTDWYGTPGTVQPFCCGHAERNNNR